MGNPLVSVIVPVYNAEDYIERNIKSIQKQTFTDWELILVDDGSTDRSSRLCDEAAESDERIRTIHQENHGVSAARNRGLDEARGTYLTFVDSDDFLHPEALEIFVKAMKETEADLVMCGHDRMESGGYLHHDTPDWSRFDTTEKVRLALLLNDLPNFVWGKMYKGSLWRNHRFPDKMLVEDMYILADVVFRAEKMAVIPDFLYVYSHEKADSQMNKSGAGYIRVRYGKFRAWKKHEEAVKAHNLPGADKCARNAVHAAVRTYILADGEDILTEEQKEEIRDYLKSHRHISTGLSISLGRSMILGGGGFLMKLYGKIQRMILARQQRHRYEKIRKAGKKK